jgi:hypothetical protein
MYELSLENILVIGGTTFVLGSFLGLFIAVKIFRRYQVLNLQKAKEYEARLALKKKQLEEKTEALQKIIYHVHHIGLNPNMKRIRALLDLILHEVKDMYQDIDFLIDMGFAVGKTKRHLDEIQRLSIRGWNVAEEMENEVLKGVKEFEHLQ